MPPATFPPTPAPSSEIAAKDCHAGSDLTALDGSFVLPPPAMADNDPSDSVMSSPDEMFIDSPFSPISPALSAKLSSTSTTSRRRSGPAQLPPPPSRSRKIIQVAPRPEPRKAASSKSAKAQTKTTSAPSTTNSPKKKQSGSGGSTNRKVARKTAHSLIERRRRSKMNEEFGVLKDMIPACKGQDMHKLAILQASIEYTRYLEHCVTELKAAFDKPPSPVTSFEPSPLPSPLDDNRSTSKSVVSEDERETSPLASNLASTSSSTLPSPALVPESKLYNVQPAGLLSPECEIRWEYVAPSCTITPQPPPLSNERKRTDQENTARALLMLREADGTRGMSVQDLLSG
ncbi:hypothetical protein L228DRAFT_268722 [Xylona heveae TC161]|uniref:BHLH domain-containing protein n=1 Tax=Xylona heveae (strain CBS 132557 / TC161) TaxID=1328760 RepID=A0A165GJ22_XYLHT|nr:hypothetical protein L228DRAFT_268722 [Xylona heveae TC161]KZF22246.1 hypothetical protein L228DRAFT_268722 [Xylona heveae TC161]